MDLSNQAYFLISVTKAKKAMHKWIKACEADPDNTDLQYGSADLWESLEELKGFQLTAKRSLQRFPSAMLHALGNLAKNFDLYDERTIDGPLPVPQTIINDFAEIEKHYDALPNLYSEEIVIESPTAMMRQGDSTYDIARSWKCYQASGELDVRTVSRELDDPGSQEHFKRHPDQLDRDKQRSEWLEFYNPIIREVENAVDMGAIPGEESIVYLYDQGHSVEDVAGRFGIDAEIIRLAYAGIESERAEGSGEKKKAQPKSRSNGAKRKSAKAKGTTKRTSKKKTAKKPVADVEANDETAEDVSPPQETTLSQELGRLTDDELFEYASGLGIAVSMPFDRDETVSKCVAAQEFEPA